MAENDASGYATRYGVAATLYAQTPYLYGYADVYNWIGMQTGDGKELSQIGIDYNNVGTFDCSNDVNNRPMVLAEDEYGGTYGPNVCFPNFIFGAGTQTFFASTYDPNGGWWNNWINWNGTWEDLISYQLAPWGLDASTALADFIPAEIQWNGYQYTRPYLPSIPDQQGQIETGNGSGWVWWFTNINTRTLSPAGQGYCVTYPTQYTNVTVSDC